MRILLDECLDWRLCRALGAHHCVSVAAKGWKGMTNGKLLQKAEREFDVFLTADSNLTTQQNLATFDLAVIVLEARSTRLSDTLPLMTQVLAALTNIQAKQVVRIRAKN
jgi:predicted nuclease of predicted toxin-antitoxin system